MPVVVVFGYMASWVVVTRRTLHHCVAKDRGGDSRLKALQSVDGVDIERGVI